MTNEPPKHPLAGQALTRTRDGLKAIGDLLKALGVFMPQWVTLLLLMWCLWTLEQGPDVLRLSSESALRTAAHGAALLFLAYVLWFSGRLLAFVRWDLLKAIRRIRRHLPRLIGATAYTVIIAALVMQALGGTTGGWRMFGTSFGAGLLWYVIVSHQADRWKPPTRNGGPDARAIMRWLELLRWSIVAFSLLPALFAGNPWAQAILLLTAQALFIILVTLRSPWMFTIPDPPIPGAWLRHLPGLKMVYARSARIFGSFQKNVTDEERTEQQLLDIRTEQAYYGVFVVVCTCAALLFLVLSACLGLSIALGPLTALLFGIAILLAFVNVLRVVAVLKHWPMAAILIAMAIILGRFGRDHHIVHTVPADTGAHARPRLGFDAYAERWFTERKDVIDSTTCYPVILVMANGGASRSGYWVAQVLGRMRDELGPAFTDHLFCLSGASGGSVGTATFHQLLAHGTADTTYMEAAHRVLRQDLLSFALTRMLGSDALQFFLPVGAFDDRARAVERSLEHAGGVVDDSLFLRTMGRIASVADTGRVPPILCINVTRMEDGRPGVISTVALPDSLKGPRIDLLRWMPPGEDLLLSTAVVTGARFPFVSPAGALELTNGRQYFVDGGYFDNSGAGVVHEMIQRLDHTLLPERFPAYAGKIRFIVVHITNSTTGVPDFGPVSPWKNDLASPLLTLIGSYSMQTDVNDHRLQEYVGQLGCEGPAYVNIGLGKGYYPMNWSISDEVLDRMRHHCLMDSTLNDLIGRLKVMLDPAGRPMAGPP